MIPQRAHNFGTYFATTQTWGRRSIFQADALARLLIATLLHYREQQKYLLHEFVLMPNHVHLLLTPLNIALERAMQLIKGGYSYRLRQTGRILEVRQSGFTDHRIRDHHDYEHHLEYLRLNPVRAGLCASPEQFVYSSASGLYSLDDVPQRLKPVQLVAEARHG
ncbi:MAG TPA: transposase [Terriglobales bacterium]|nr:transposase [Terriglobales bacterium]